MFPLSPVGQGAGSFPNPFIDIATLSMPQSMRSALYHSEYVFSSQGTYRMAMSRVVGYFLTDVEFPDLEADDEEKKKLYDFMHETLGIVNVLHEAMIDRMAYGNRFTSLQVPFKRLLRCPRCSLLVSLKEVYERREFKFSWSDFKFVATCPACATGSGYHGPWHIIDEDDDKERKIRVKRWSPHEIEILHDYYSDDVAYLWRIPEDYKSQVRKGNLFHLERVTLPVMEAIKRNQMFRFNTDAIHHMKEPTLAGIRNRGWGIPRILSNYRQIYYVQVLRRYNEAIALDYVIPFRLITPAPRPGGAGGGGGINTQDPMQMFSMNNAKADIRRMLNQRRRDPAGWHMLPFPVQFQMLGGDASKLAPKDMLDQGTEQLLNDAGCPVELFKGTLTMQAAPPALRLFESTWSPLVHDANGLLRWLVRQLSQIMGWEAIDTKLKRTTIADDINTQMARLQLYMGNQLSGDTALKGLGLNWQNEQRTMAHETQTQAKIQAEAQKETDQFSFGQQIANAQAVPAGGAPGGAAGGSPTGGAPAGQMQPGQPMPGPVDQYLSSQGPNTPVTPDEMMQTADSLAQQLLGTDAATKNRQLKALKQHNQVLHSVVLQALQKIRTGARQQGGQQVLQQQFGPQAQ